MGSWFSAHLNYGVDLGNADRWNFISEDPVLNIYKGITCAPDDHQWNYEIEEQYSDLGSYFENRLVVHSGFDPETNYAFQQQVKDALKKKNCFVELKYHGALDGESTGILLVVQGIGHSAEGGDSLPLTTDDLDTYSDWDTYVENGLGALGITVEDNPRWIMTAYRG